ncbi:MAG: hypothetical protein JXO44_15260, partial [Clostridia bacterium]|nr:hypothetical protein [Clostridia bacterium]
QNGQGGSGQAYSEASDHIDQKTLFRTDSESLETGHENSAFHVTGIGGEETHLTLGKDVEAMNTLQTDSKSSSMSITLDERTVTIPSGIPENRLELIRAYYEGE